jgi:hypothetical protein
MSSESAEFPVSANTRVIDPFVFSNEVSRKLTKVRLASGSDTQRPDVDITQSAGVVRAHIVGVSQVKSMMHPGWRGALASRLKKQIRRLIYWYVDPVFELRREITDLQNSLADLRQSSRRLQKASRSLALNRCAPNDSRPSP